MDVSTTDIDEIDMVGFLEGQYSKKLPKFLQFMITWKIKDIQEDSWVSTLQISTRSHDYFTTDRIVWVLGDICTYRKVYERFTWRDFEKIALAHIRSILFNFPDKN